MIQVREEEKKEKKHRLTRNQNKKDKKWTIGEGELRKNTSRRLRFMYARTFAFCQYEITSFANSKLYVFFK